MKPTTGNKLKGKKAKKPAKGRGFSVYRSLDAQQHLFFSFECKRAPRTYRCVKSCIKDYQWSNYWYLNMSFGIHSFALWKILNALHRHKA